MKKIYSLTVVLVAIQKHNNMKNKGNTTPQKVHNTSITEFKDNRNG
jgi:hypothetical protein